MIYMVEHDVSDSAREAAWNVWYSNHAMYGFRKVPGWRTGQRFVAIPPTEPKYRAMYTIENADVLTSAAYKATTGGRFPEEWRTMIVDFHRNLADADWMPAVEKDQSLIVCDNPAAEAELNDVKLQWMNIVGLEKTVSRRAIAVTDRSTGEAIAARKITGIGAYTPVFDRWMI